MMMNNNDDENNDVDDDAIFRLPALSCRRYNGPETRDDEATSSTASSNNERRRRYDGNGTKIKIKSPLDSEWGAYNHTDDAGCNSSSWFYDPASFWGASFVRSAYDVQKFHSLLDTTSNQGNNKLVLQCGHPNDVLEEEEAYVNAVTNGTNTINNNITIVDDDQDDNNDNTKNSSARIEKETGAIVAVDEDIKNNYDIISGAEKYDDATSTDDHDTKDNNKMRMKTKEYSSNNTQNSIIMTEYCVSMKKEALVTTTLKKKTHHQQHIKSRIGVPPKIHYQSITFGI